MRKLQKANPDEKRGVFLFLDFDGTLSRIVGHPKDAVIRSDAQKWLKTLLIRKNVKIAVVTGRSLFDIRRRVRSREIYYVANHGMEIFYKDRFLQKRGQRFKGPLKRFGDEITNTLAHIPGIFTEDKGLSVAVHFRQAAKDYHGFVKKIICEMAAPIMKKYGLEVTKGKMIVELRPASFWNKGNAIKWLWKKIAPGYFPVYIGDDVTDEDAFKELRRSGLTIRIGMKKKSHAQYYVPSIKTVIRSNLLKGIE